jgi:hypothetical protein
MAQLEELSDILADYAKSSLGGGNTPAQEPVEATGANTVVTTEPVVTEPVTVEPDASKQAEPTVVAEPKTTEPEPVPDIFSDWDADPTTPEPIAPVTTGQLPVDVLNELGKVLGLEKVQGKEDVVAAITAIKAEAEKAKGPDKAQIRPELLKAIELDQKGGDYKEYLKVVSENYSNADPVQLYEDYIFDRATDANGNVDVDKVEEYLNSITDFDKELRGKDLQSRLVQDQARKVAEIETAAIRQREKTDAELKAALSSITEIDGFKINDRHRSESFDWVSSGKMMKDLFYDANGNLDPNKVAKNAFRMKYYEKLDAYQKNKIRNGTKREILADLTSAQISTPPIQVNPTNPKSYGISDYINQLEQRMINK